MQLTKQNDENMQQLEMFASEASIIVHYYTLRLCTLLHTHSAVQLINHWT